MIRIPFLFVVLVLLAALAVGCAGEGSANEGPGSAPVDQVTAGSTPSSELVDPSEQGGASAAAGEQPSILGSTPEAGLVGAWERHRFFDVWDVGYPDGWTVDRPGTGTIVLAGAYGEHDYTVEIGRPTGVQTPSLADWVQSDLETIDQPGAPREEASVAAMPALKVTNLRLPGQAENECPAVRVYARTDKVVGDDNYIVMTVTQTGDTACDPASVVRLADALVAEVRN